MCALKLGPILDSNKDEADFLGDRIEFRDVRYLNVRHW